jgi:nucleotide-binding universal stress UspA family protein
VERITVPETELPRIVVGVDGSEPSKAALRWAAAVAQATRARLDAVIAWQYDAEYVPTDLEPAHDAEKVLSATVDEVFGADRPADMRLTVKQGGAAAVLLQESSGALMAVVGSRGHGGFMGLLLGSVSSALAEHSSCPVLVIHGDGRPPVFAS